MDKKDYHKITELDCLSVATKEETQRLFSIFDLSLSRILARRWCKKNGYKIGGYLGNGHWDATTISLDNSPIGCYNE